MRVNLTLYTSRAEYIDGAATRDHNNIDIEVVAEYVDRFMTDYKLTSYDMVSHVTLLSPKDHVQADEAEAEYEHDSGLVVAVIPIEPERQRKQAESMVEGLRRIKQGLTDEGELP